MQVLVFDAAEFDKLVAAAGKVVFQPTLMTTLAQKYKSQRTKIDNELLLHSLMQLDIFSQFHREKVALIPRNMQHANMRTCKIRHAT